MRNALFVLLTLGTVSAFAADPFAIYQWGINNQGQPQTVDLDPLHTYKVPARAQEDVRLPAPQKAKKKVLVAVLDTGIQKDHPDLKNVIHRNETECRALAKFNACLEDKDRKECEAKWMDLKNPEVDMDKNGYPLDCQGWSLLGAVNPTNKIMGRPDFGDDQGHGTHVAGIIAAEVGNNVGIRGLSENVEILPVQVIGVQPSEPIKPLSIYDSPSEEGRENIKKSLGDVVARGVIYAMHSGAQVINFSMGWPQTSDSEFMRKVIEEAQARGIIIVAAAGNDSTRALLRPCAYPNVICVSAAGPDGAMAHFSNFGSGVDIVAPGLNILSTYPEGRRPVRFRSTLGYEYLSGTSQASPYVAAAVAELLARGVPANEVYARLVLGSRPLLSNLSLVSGGSHEQGRVLSPEKEVYKKYSVGGNMDVERALKVPAQPLITIANKEKSEIVWDRKSKDLNFEISFVNKWAPVDISQVRMTANFLKPHPEAARPWVTSIKEIAPYAALWKTGEVRKYTVAMTIVDAADPSQSRIPSELDLTVDVSVNGQEARRYVLESEVTVEVNANLAGSDIQTFPIVGMPKGRFSFIPLDQNLDADTNQRDYLALIENKNTWQLYLVADAGNGTYKASGGTKIQIEGKSDNLLDKVTARMDMNGDGRSEYVLGVLEDKTEEEDYKGSPTSFFVFDSSLKLVDSFKYDGVMAPMPVDASQIYWQSIGGTKRPTWLGGGKDPDRKRDLKDYWENPDNYEQSKLRLYFLNEKNQLKALRDHEDYQIVDIIQPRQDQVEAGRIAILLAKNQGTEAKPSYLYDFAVAEVVNGKIENFMELDLFHDSNVYRNILDTRVDKIQNLDYNKDEFAGSFWFGEGLSRKQRLTLFDNKDFDLLDRQLGAQRSQFDSALRVRAVFAGQQRKGAFVLTNSEIQYHDLLSGQVWSKSLDRYTFFPDNLFISLYIPLTLRDARNASIKIPGIFTTESAGLSRGVKMLVPVFAKDGSAIELVSPARLRFKSSGCRSMETPVFDGAKGAHSFDYYCGDKLLRVNLTY
ncbi:serine protease [Bdellovibrio bacteriovorus]|uniref:Serine protease n=1 Tax=Bdellovibrio bacteriovorus TaxID=959 RepID=A0A161PSL2_BDEBC|nr:S8 family serine peptidase [Bdellovibrio bacteriovorus]KYG67706.1 serine protease [Bdellovibrio bacteriovorus]